MLKVLETIVNVIHNFGSYGVGEGASGTIDIMADTGMSAYLLLQDASILDMLEVGACGYANLVRRGVAPVNGCHVGVGGDHAVANVRFFL